MRRLSLIAALAAALTAACAQDIRVSERADGGRRFADATSMTDDDATSGTEDGAVIDDAGNMNTPDGGTPVNDSGTMTMDAATRECIVDPFMPCSDPDEAMRTNNEWSSATYFNNNMSVGCPTGDNLVTLDMTRESLLCPAEPADWYQLNFVCCDTRTIFVELRLHPITDCDVSAWDFQLLSVPCTDPDVTCSMEGNDRVVRARIEPCGVVFGWYFGVLQMAQDLKLQYSLTAKVM